MANTRPAKNRTYQNLYTILNQAGFAKRFKTFKPCAGTIELLSDRGGGEVEHVPLDELANEIIRIAQIGKDIDLGPSDAKPMAHWWVVNNYAEAGLKVPPAPILSKSQKGLCFMRLPFDYVQSGNLPIPYHFQEFCGRSNDPEVMKAFIGSLFVAESYRQQYLYIFGRGGDGKGTLFNLLEKMMGQTFTAEDVPEKIAPFWTSGLIGKRLCVFPDLEDPKFPFSSRFKKLTGDDAIRVEGKYKDKYTAKISTKFIMASNDQMKNLTERADERRALYIIMKPFTGAANPNYLEFLWSEAPSIYSQCIEAYRRECPNHGMIYQGRRAPIVEVQETIEDIFFTKFFTIEPRGMVIGKDWVAAKAKFFGRKPTKEEDKLLEAALLKRGCTYKRESTGMVARGIQHRSALSMVHS